MSSPNLSFSFLFLFFFLLSLSSSSPLSTIAISHLPNNKTLVCALLPSTSTSASNQSQFSLNCTSFPNGTTHHYPSGLNPYSAIAAGNGFLCALTSPFGSNTSSMRWWDFAHNKHNTSIPDAKRVYLGPSLVSLSAGDSHVCGLVGNTKSLDCWRWSQLDIPSGIKATQIAVGANFVCGILGDGVVKCFGNDDGVVGNEPAGNYTTISAGRSHVCAISVNGGLDCWGFGAPKITESSLSIESMALGMNKTCVLDTVAKVHCYGENFRIPADVEHEPFVAIQARGDDFCAVLMSNFSLICWGSEKFSQNHVVFKQVLPGACAMSCPWLPIAGTGNICGNGAQVCRPRPTRANPNSPRMKSYEGSSNHNRRRLIFIILGSVGFVIGIAAAACFIFFKIRQKHRRIHDSERLQGPRWVRGTNQLRSSPTPDLAQLFNKGHSTTVEEFPINFLLAITDGFSEEHKIGSGSFGSVYRATLADGRIVAIKRAGSTASTSTSRARTPNQYVGLQDKDSAFFSELALLSCVNHKNLVRLFGYCQEGSERILVYEYMPNGTLNDHLHKTDQQLGSPLGSWAARIRVALDAARGIEYLHTYAVPPIIHRDIKSSNILLDASWTAKVSDFGLSLMSPGGAENNDGSDVQLSAAGTVGYMDPEYYLMQHLTDKSDVYSFGVVLLEILTGCKVIQKYEESGTPRNVVEFAVPRILADDIHFVLDARLPLPMPSEIEAVAYVGNLAADCVNAEGRDRPTMTQIVNGLEWALGVISGPSGLLSRSPTASTAEASCP